MNVKNFSLLKTLTQEFFGKYWNTQILGDAPMWSDIDKIFRPIPNYDKRGVYAFVKGEEITYIGVGAAKGSDKYPNHGLSARFNRYCQWIDKPNDIYGAIDERLKDAGAVVTIGFDPEHAHLAYSLEIFLISRMSPQHNKIGR